MSNIRECGNCTFFYGVTAYEGICEGPGNRHCEDIVSIDSCCLGHRFPSEIKGKLRIEVK